MRTCACGCGADLDALKMRRHARYASGACRARVARYRAARYDEPLETAQKPHTAPPRVNLKPSGLQVSYRKAVEAMATYLEYEHGYGRWAAQRSAEAALGPALSDRQRAQLDERS